MNTPDNTAPNTTGYIPDINQNTGYLPAIRQNTCNTEYIPISNVKQPSEGIVIDLNVIIEKIKTFMNVNKKYILFSIIISMIVVCICQRFFISKLNSINKDPALTLENTSVNSGNSATINQSANSSSTGDDVSNMNLADAASGTVNTSSDSYQGEASENSDTSNDQNNNSGNNAQPVATDAATTSPDSQNSGPTDAPAVEGNSTAKKGIDVSVYQGDINWSQVKEGKIDYAMIQAGFRGYGTGNITVDKKFYRNLDAALAVGIDTGVYFFSQAINPEEATAEADYVLSKVTGYKLAYPIAISIVPIEDASARTNTANLGTAEWTAIAKAFCEKIKGAGYIPCIYSTVDYFNTKFDLSQLSGYDLWVSSISSTPPSCSFSYSMWQNSNTGSVFGIETATDLNLCYKKY